MKLPLVIINFKAYKEGSGERALKLAKIIERVSKKYGVSFIVAPQFCDIRMIAIETSLPVISQHIDPVESYGAFTGHIIPRNVKEAGAIGTLINHSERKLSLKEIEKCITIAKKLRLITFVCSPNLAESERIAKLGPDFLAYEDPSLIGSGRAISKVKPESVKNFVEKVLKINPKVVPLCGAGISSGEDVKLALKLGTKGVIIASAIVKKKDPEPLLVEIAKCVKD